MREEAWDPLAQARGNSIHNDPTLHRKRGCNKIQQIKECFDISNTLNTIKNKKKRKS